MEKATMCATQQIMHKLQIFIGCGIILGAVIASPSGANPTNQTSLPADLMQTLQDWSACRSNKVLQRVNSNVPDEAVVDSALAECASVEVKAMQLWEKHYGQGSKHQLVTIRDKWRTGLIAQVKNLRTGTPLTDPYAIWGRCVRTHLATTRAEGQSSQAVADAALNACLAEQQAIQTAIAGKFGNAKAVEQIKVLRSEMRKQAIAVQAQ